MSYLDRKDLLSANLITRSISKEKAIKYYNTDKNIAYIYMKLVTENEDGAQKEVAVDEASNYTVILNIKKPGNQLRKLTGVLSNDLVYETSAIYKFTLSSDYIDQVNDYLCETVVKSDTKELVLNPFKYSVSADIATGLNGEIIIDKDYSILKELISKVQKTNNINDIKVSETETYSNKKIEEKFSGVDAQFNTIEQKKADKTEVDIERKRLDNIIANANDTEGNSELVDIRIGADGTVYDCAGKAVREQFNANNTKIQESASKNIEQDTRLIDIEQKNKVQDVYLNGLFNENADGRLSINGEGNNLKLEGSKAGLVTVDSVVGNSLANCFKGFDVYKDKHSAFKVTKRTLEMVGINSYPAIVYKDFVFKPNTTYTLIINVEVLTIQNPNYNLCLLRVGEGDGKTNINVKSPTTVGLHIVSFTTPNVEKIVDAQTFLRDGATPEQSVKLSDMVIIEGDYTNKPIPTQVFEGIQSTFEENKVTQEMVTAGIELASNLGKYKVNAKVVGKNLFNPNSIKEWYLDDTTQTIRYSQGTQSIIFRCRPNTDYYISFDKAVNRFACAGFQEFPTIDTPYRDIMVYKPITNQCKFNSGNNNYILYYYNNVPISVNAQIEEDSQATPYEPYFESSHNVYLNSPLLKGDVLECRNDGVYHVHNMKKAVLDGTENWGKWAGLSNEINTVGFYFVLLNLKPNTSSGSDSKQNIISNAFPWSSMSKDREDSEKIITSTNNTFYLRIGKSKLTTQDVLGLKTWLQNNPVTIVYELAAPYEEKVSDNKFLCEIANGSTLHLDSNIPVQSMKATYTSNVVSVVKLDKIQYQQDQINLDNVYRLTMLETTMGI